MKLIHRAGAVIMAAAFALVGCSSGSSGYSSSSGSGGYSGSSGSGGYSGSSGSGGYSSSGGSGEWGSTSYQAAEPAQAAPPAPVGWPEGGLGWDQAGSYAGTYQRVCGPLISMRNTYDGAFVNVGRDYPHPGRFTFILWGYELQPLPRGATICASGSIYIYEGTTAQIELGSPAELEIWE